MTNDLEETDVLLVEDNEEVSKVMCAFLSTLSISYKSTGDPEEALNFLDNYKFKVCVLDINLNSELTGVDLSVIIRSKFPTAKIYALTGHSKLFDNISPGVAGFDDAFFKPVGYEEFTKTIMKDLNLLKK